MEVPHQDMNPIVKYLKDKLNKLEKDSILKLMTHKKKSLLFTLPNLPAATGSAFTIPNIRKGFIYNEQLDTESSQQVCLVLGIWCIHSEVILIRRI